MYDPQTVAHEVRYPWRKYGSKGRNGFERAYRASLVTIWHVDPEKAPDDVCVRRGDDTCGWHTPPYRTVDRERIRKLGTQQYSTIFNKQWAVAENKDYVRVCYEPSAYDAIYWAWRAIKHQERKGTGWQYGKPLSAKEQDYIYSLAANPVDNLRMRFAEVHDAESCADFFMTVYCCYLRFNRPWWRHPRWHIHHWKFQVHPWQQFRRWALTRCAGCGERFHYGESPVSHSWDRPRTPWFRSEIGLYHSKCSDTHRKVSPIDVG